MRSTRVDTPLRWPRPCARGCARCHHGFRRFLQPHDLTAKIFATINAHLAKRGLLLRQGTMVDATIMAAPSSTKNREGRRDPDMLSGAESEPRTAKKGNQWHFVRGPYRCGQPRPMWPMSPKRTRCCMDRRPMSLVMPVSRGLKSERTSKTKRSDGMWR